MQFQKGNKLAGNRKGRPNRAPREAREAIARFVDRNAPRLQRWLDAVANGLREADQPGPDGEMVPGKWIVKPDPVKAFELFTAVIEYHVPKLSRAEIVREDKPTGRVIDSSRLTQEQRQQLREMLLEQIGTEGELLGHH